MEISMNSNYICIYISTICFLVSIPDIGKNFILKTLLIWHSFLLISLVFDSYIKFCFSLIFIQSNIIYFARLEKLGNFSWVWMRNKWKHVSRLKEAWWKNNVLQRIFLDFGLKIKLCISVHLLLCKSFCK